MASRQGGDVTPAAILGVLGTRGLCSRTELARLLGVSPATITTATKELVARSLIREVADESSRGGRPARLLGLVKEAGKAVGVKVSADHVSLVVVGLDGAVDSLSTYPLDATEPRALDGLARIVHEAVASQPGRLLGVGVGVPGSVDSQESGVVTAPTLGWSALPVGARLRSELGIPVLVDNDVNTLAAAEQVHGIGLECRSYLVVTIGRGVGGGIVVDGVVQRGSTGGAGEIGHLPVQLDGPVCECGGRGCLESLIGEAALVAMARQSGLIPKDGTVATLQEEAAAGNAGCAALFRQAGALLGLAVAGVVHCVDPEIVVIQGEGVVAWPAWSAGFEESFRGHLMGRRRGIPFLVRPWSEQEWARGAASLVLAAPFDSSGTSGEQGRLVRARLQRHPEVSSR